MISLVIEYLHLCTKLHGVEFIVILIAHDGILIGTPQPIAPTSQTIKEIQKGCTEFVRSSIGIAMPMELELRDLSYPDV